MSIKYNSNFDVDLQKKSTSSLSFFLIYCKEILQTCCFGYFGHEWQCPAKLIVSTYRKTWFWSACKKSSSYLPSFLWFCKDIANLLFWVLWACLTTPTKTNDINLKETLIFIYMQKIKNQYLDKTIFLKILFLPRFFNSDKVSLCQISKGKTIVQVRNNTAFRQKDAQMDKHEFIGLFQLKPWGAIRIIT